MDHTLPPINRNLLPVARTIHREEAVPGIVIHVELIVVLCYKYGVSPLTGKK